MRRRLANCRSSALAKRHALDGLPRGAANISGKSPGGAHGLRSRCEITTRCRILKQQLRYRAFRPVGEMVLTKIA
jgi:hypothetical protein